MNTNSLNLSRRAVLLFLVLVFLAFTVSPVMAFKNINVDESVRFLPDPNDDINNALEITALPYRITVSPFEATKAPDDPASIKCNLNPGLQSVWYKYKPAVNVMVHMDTIGSNYDTYMVLWTGLIGSLKEVACNDDADASTFSSAINITLTGGVTYYIEVAQQFGSITLADVVSAKVPLEAGNIKGATTHVFRLVPRVAKVFRSVGLHDGYVVESTETSNVGLFKNSTLPYLTVGDDAQKRQYRAILSFNTASLPDNAVITNAVIKVKKKAVSAGNIFSKLGTLRVDISSPRFGNFLALEIKDFNAIPSMLWVGTFGTVPISDWYRVFLNSKSFPFFNLKGYTQFRLRFAKDDNNDTIADYLRLYSGESAAKPLLIIWYYVP